MENNCTGTLWKVKTNQEFYKPASFYFTEASLQYDIRKEKEHLKKKSEDKGKLLSSICNGRLEVKRVVVVDDILYENAKLQQQIFLDTDQLTSAVKGLRNKKLEKH